MRRTVSNRLDRTIPSVYSGVLFERLDTHDAAKAEIGIPHGDGGGGIVDPEFARVRVGLRKHIFGPTIGAGIESQDTAAMDFAAPDLAVLVGCTSIKIGVRRVRSWRPKFADPSRFGVDFNKGAVHAGEPGVAKGIETASLSGERMRTGCEILHLAGANIEEFERVAVRPDRSTSGPKIPVGRH